MKRELEKYYTSKDTVDSLKGYFEFIKKQDTIIEPSAGSGVFLEFLHTICDNVLAFDIAPEHPEIVKQDYLIMNNPKSDEKIHVVGNPPFGRQSSLAKKFIKKSCLFSDTISFILPKSFKKASFDKTFPLNFHKTLEIDLKTNSFLLNGNSYDVPCVFQIWIKKDFDRSIPPIEKAINFEFVRKDEPHDISFQRIGSRAGKVETHTDDKNIQSHYFIKFEKVVDLDKYKNLEFPHNNTVGPKSISKPELINMFNKV